MAKNLFIVALVLLSIQSTYAQTAIVTAGGENDAVSYSIGQAIVGTATGENGSAEIGVQQTYVLIVSQLKNVINDLDASVTVYPNPTSNILQVKIETDFTTEVSYSLISNSGQLIFQGKSADSNHFQIGMETFPIGTYILRIEQTGKVYNCQVIKK